MSPLLAAIDHVVILAHDGAEAVQQYETLFGRSAGDRRVEDGVAISTIATSNVGVELMSPHGAGERADRVRAALASGEGLKSLVFRTSDIDGFRRRVERLGMAPGEITTAGNGDRSLRLSDAAAGGVRLFVIERATPPESTRVTDGVVGLDHVVVQTADAERAAALYGARLGLDMRLDREVRGRRLMFFRCGDAIVEIAVDPEAKADRLWGLSWRVADADAARTRLADEGFNVSDVRTGAKPGTRVFTVRDRTAGVPTLMIELSTRRD